MCAGRVAACEQRPTLVEQPLEDRGVELLGIDREYVTAPAREEHRGVIVAKDLAQPRHGHAHGIARAPRPRAPEQLIDQPLGADQLVRVHEQHGE